MRRNTVSSIAGRRHSRRRRTECQHARIGDVVDVGHQGREAAAMDQLRAGQRHGAIGAAMKAAKEGDGPRPAGVPAGQLQRGFERLGAAVGEEDAVVAGQGAGSARRWDRSICGW